MEETVKVKRALKDQKLFAPRSSGKVKRALPDQEFEKSSTRKKPVRKAM
jgi:hypothetical protein